MTIGIQQVRSFSQGKATEPLVKTMEVCGILARDAVNPFPPPSRSIIHGESFRIGQGRQQELLASLPEGLT